jgi:hypothetical protein
VLNISCVIGWRQWRYIMEWTVSSSYLNQDGPTWACTHTDLCWAFKDVSFVSELFPKFLYWVYLAVCTDTGFFSTKTCTCQLWAGIVSNRAVLLAFKVLSRQRNGTMNLLKAWECLLINIHTWRVGKFVPTSDTRYCIFLAEVYRVEKGNKKSCYGELRRTYASVNITTESLKKISY